MKGTLNNGKVSETPLRSPHSSCYVAWLLFRNASLVGMKERKKDPREDEEGNERSESARSFRVRAKSVVRLLQGYTRLKVIWDWQVTSLFL